MAVFPVVTALPSATASRDGYLLATDFVIFQSASTAVSALNAGDELLPTQATHSGKYITTNGTVASWALALPDQTDQDGKYLNTNAGIAAWQTLYTTPTASGHNGEYLSSDGDNYQWANIPAELPSQFEQSGKFLTTDGTSASWSVTGEEVPSQTGNENKFLYTDGTSLSWVSTPAWAVPDPSGATDGMFLMRNAAESGYMQWVQVGAIPSQGGNGGKYLITDGVDPSWATVSVLPANPANRSILIYDGADPNWSTTLPDDAGVISIDPDNRILYSSDGTTTAINFDSTSGPTIKYTPANSGDWDGDPTTTTEAIDRIASVVGLTAPIP